MPKPVCYTSKGEANSPDFPNFDPLETYRIIARGIYIWEGLPKDVPEGFIEEMLFKYGCVSAKDVPGLGQCIFAASPVLKGIYGDPISWLPTAVQGRFEYPGLMDQSTNPCLWIGQAPQIRAEIYADILYKSLLALRQNVVSLSQPIMLDGRPGNTADAEILDYELKSGVLSIPVIDAERIGVKVLDLKAADHTQSLIATANAMNNEILSIIGVKNTGTEKSSGINIAEATSVHQELSLKSDNGLNLRTQWCERMEEFGFSFKVRLSDAYKQEEIKMPEGPLDGEETDPIEE